MTRSKEVAVPSTPGAVGILPIERVHARLCVKDSRYPLHEDIYGGDEERPIPRRDCACDNCFYGRDTLALEILRLRGDG